MCKCSKTDKVISGMFLYICLAIGSTVLTVILVEWLYIIPLRHQQAQSNSFVSGNASDVTDVVYNPTTDSTQPLILNVSDSEDCIRECAIIYARESTVYYMNKTCFCMTIAQLNALIQQEQSTVDYDTDVQPLPAPITEGMDLSLHQNDDTECLLPGDQCTKHDQCCDTELEGGESADLQCLPSSNGVDGICCVMDSAFGCVSDGDCCSDSTECLDGFCLKSDGSRRRMAVEELTAELYGVTFSMTTQWVIIAAVSIIVILIAFCIWFVVRPRSKTEGLESLHTMVYAP